MGFVGGSVYNIDIAISPMATIPNIVPVSISVMTIPANMFTQSFSSLVRLNTTVNISHSIAIATNLFMFPPFD